jgi:AcrR family transcriptional regulator
VVTQRERRERTVGALLTAATELIGERGYAAVTVDDVVIRAGVAKGAFYHHFASKVALLDRLVDDLQAAIARELAEHRTPDPLTASDLASALEAYLRLAARPERRRILLVDGPEVLGWERWRAIDDRHFAAMTRAGIGQIASVQDTDVLEAVSRLVLGAVMEAALVTGRASDTEEAAARFGEALRQLLEGVTHHPRSRM